MANLTIVIEDRLLQADQAARERAERALAIAARALPSPEKAWPGREGFYEEVLQSRKLAGSSPSKPGRRPGG